MPPWQPGQSGNPHGRPKKARAWTKILEAAGNVRETLPDGSQVTRKKLMAEMIMQGISTGMVKFPDGKTSLKLAPKDWLDLVWKAYGQIDGPPPRDVDITSGGDKISGPQVFLPAVLDDEGEGEG